MVASLNLNNHNQTVGDVTVRSHGGQINGGTLTADSYTFENNRWHDLTITANLAGSGASLTQEGRGTTTLSGNNTYGGDTVINRGTLVANNAHALGNSSNVTIDHRGTLELDASNTIGTLTIGSHGGSIIGVGTLTATSYTFDNDECHPVTITANLAGNAASLTQNGSGTTTLSGDNTYSGGTFVYGGVLKAGSDTAFSDGLITVNDGGTVDVHGHSMSNAFHLAGYGFDDQGALINSSRHHTAVLDGTITLTADAAIGGRGNLILSGTITDPLATRNPLIKALAQGLAVLFQNYALLGSSLTKVGSGTLTLSNTSNTYGGQTIIEDGVLAITADGSLGSVPLFTMARLLVLNGGTLEALNTLTLNAKRGITISEYSNGGLAAATGTVFTVNPVIAGNEVDLQINPQIRHAHPTGTVILAGRNTYTGETEILGGTVQTNVSYTTTRTGSYSSLGSNTDLYINGGILNLNNHNQTVGDVTVRSHGGQINGGTLTADSYTFENNRWHDLTITANLAGSGASLTQEGRGTTTLSGNNTYGGDTVINRGTLVANNAHALGNSSNVTIDHRGTLELDASNTIGTLTIGSHGGSIIGVGTLTATSYTFDNDECHPVTITANLAGNAASLTQNGSGTTTLSGDNTYSGGTFVYGGVLKAGSDTAFSDGLITVNDGGTVDVHGHSMSNAFHLAGYGFDDQGALINSSRHHTAVLDGTITLTADAAIGGRGNLILSGTITDPLATRNPLIKALAQGLAVLFQNYALLGSSLTKVGSGTLTLSNTSNTYGGQTIIEDGVLAITADGSLGSVPLFTMARLLVLNGGTLEALNTLTLNAKRGITISEYSNGGLAAATGTVFTVNPVIAGNEVDLQINPQIRHAHPTGTVILAGRNTYTGETEILGGTVQTNVSYTTTRTGSYSSLGSNTDLYINGGILNLNNHNQTVGDVTVRSHGGQINGGTLTADSYTFENNRWHDLTITANLAGSGASLTQEGRGTTTLSGNNTYGGDTVINRGTLVANNAHALGNSSNVTIDHRGTLELDASNTIGTLTIGSHGGSIIGVGTLTATSY
ncbi:autotransporter-associated beta strand protein, partial [Polynucleobacter sphagniphilus]|uniref:autotransporter-associated beta strand repeat-containing protein n=1 Tax=Polynucleobacter sphagniphilus TaxID=1743169 RepID=UPI0024740647